MEKSIKGEGFSNWTPRSNSVVLSDSTKGASEQFMNPWLQRIGLAKFDYISVTTPRDYHVLAKADNILPWI